MFKFESNPNSEGIGPDNLAPSILLTKNKKKIKIKIKIKMNK